MAAMVALPLAGACSDDSVAAGPATSVQSAQSSSGTGGMSSTQTSSSTGGIGGSNAFVTPTPVAVPLSMAGADQLQSATAAAGGDFYAAGFAQATLTDPRFVTVVKLSASGLVTSWGTGGIVTTPLAFVGGSDEIDITTQSDGKILVSATVANATNTADRDVAVIRLLDDGSVDTTFGTAGIATVNLNDAHDNGMMLVAMDQSRSITVDGDDNVFVHANSRGLGDSMLGGPRTDTDFTVVKLSLDGVVDAAFGTAGQFRLDIQESSSTARQIRALSDDTLLAGGYANTPDVGSVQPVLYKLTAAGELDPAFATGGFFHEAILATQTEIYGFALHGDNAVTAGYGRNTGDTNDYVSLRFDITNGTRDLTWGRTPNGAVLVDPSGMMLGSNARGAIALPGGETVIMGSTGPSNAPEQDAVFVVLDAEGMLDTAYGTGIHVIKLGNDGNDQFWGGALSGNTVALVGYQGGGMTPTDTQNDDAYAVFFEVQ